MWAGQRTWHRQGMRDLPTLLLARDCGLHGLTSKDLSKQVNSGALVRVRHGVYADGPAWRELKDWQKYRLQIQAAAEMFEKPTIFARHSAASVWGSTHHRRPPSCSGACPDERRREVAGGGQAPLRGPLRPGSGPARRVAGHVLGPNSPGPGRVHPVRGGCCPAGPCSSAGQSTSARHSTSTGHGSAAARAEQGRSQRGNRLNLQRGKAAQDPHGARLRRCLVRFRGGVVQPRAPSPRRVRSSGPAAGIQG